MGHEHVYYCIGCNATHSNKRDFYTSFNPTHQNGVYPFCKDYIKETVYTTPDRTHVDTGKFQGLLRQMDAPFLIDVLKDALNAKSDTVGTYFKLINARQNRGQTWEDSRFSNDTDSSPEDIHTSIISKKAVDLTSSELSGLEDKWGFGYDAEEYILFEKKWTKLIDNYGRKTAMHVEGLKTYIRFRVKEELSTARGDVKEAKEWGNLASKAATDAKINVSQLSKSDISGGVDVLPQLFEAVESKVGIIPQLPKLLEQPYDDADIIIWCNINYIRRLEDKPRVSYREIWDFYDEMLEEHCKQKGMTEQQIEEFKAKRRVPYCDLGEVYTEPVYEDGDI